MCMWICPKSFPNENETCVILNFDYYCYRNKKKSLKGNCRVILTYNGTISFSYKDILLDKSLSIKVNQWYFIEFNLIPCDKQVTVNCEIKIHEEHKGSHKIEINKIDYSFAKKVFHRDSQITSVNLLQNFIGLFGGFCVYDGAPEFPQFEFKFQENLESFYKRIQMHQHFELKYHLCLFPF